MQETYYRAFVTKDGLRVFTSQNAWLTEGAARTNAACLVFNGGYVRDVESISPEQALAECKRIEGKSVC